MNVKKDWQDLSMSLNNIPKRRSEISPNFVRWLKNLGMRIVCNTIHLSFTLIKKMSSNATKT